MNRFEKAKERANQQVVNHKPTLIVETMQKKIPDNVIKFPTKFRR